MDTNEVFQCAEGLLNIGKRLKKQNAILGETAVFLAHQTLSLIEQAQTQTLKQAPGDHGDPCKTQLNPERSAFHKLPPEDQEEVKDNINEILEKRIHGGILEDGQY